MKSLYNIKLKIKTIYSSVSLFLIYILIRVSTISVHALSSGDPGYIPQTTMSTQSDFMSKLQDFNFLRNLGLSGFMGFAVFTTILVFIYNICKLAYVASNPNERKQVLTNLLICGCCFMLEGCSATIWVLLNWFTA